MTVPKIITPFPSDPLKAWNKLCGWDVLLSFHLCVDRALPPAYCHRRTLVVEHVGSAGCWAACGGQCQWCGGEEEGRRHRWHCLAPLYSALPCPNYCRPPQTSLFLILLCVVIVKLSFTYCLWNYFMLLYFLLCFMYALWFSSLFSISIVMIKLFTQFTVIPI